MHAEFVSDRESKTNTTFLFFRPWKNSNTTRLVKFSRPCFRWEFNSTAAIRLHCEFFVQFSERREVVRVRFRQRLENVRFDPFPLPFKDS
jgi:hypothetical protein